MRLLRLQTSEPVAGSADSRQLKGVTENAVTTVKSVGFFQYRRASILEKAPRYSKGVRKPQKLKSCQQLPGSILARQQQDIVGQVKLPDARLQVSELNRVGFKDMIIAIIDSDCRL